MTATTRELPSGTVTFLFTDIEGSTRLLAGLGDGYAEALSEHRRVLRAAVEVHGGVEIDTQGDAFFVAFADAASAVAAAAQAQAALALPVRMGVHTGEPELTGDGYVGLDVHRGARICAVAHGGQVVISARTRELVPECYLVLRDLGLHRLKDLAEPVRLYQLGDTEFPPLRSLNATNLPVQPNALVGREREVAEVTALLRDGARLVTLTGPGGTGKTRIALQAAAELLDDFPDGVFWVPVAALRDPELVLPTIEQTLGAKTPLAEHVDEKRILLLLDNLEQVIECAPALADVLSACPGMRLLVTSRLPLHIDGEHEYPVAPLTTSECVLLFRERATSSEPEAAVVEICRRVDGLPLAVELAAARTRTLTPEQLLARLERRLPLLTGRRRDVPERQRTLRATVEWSYELLTPDERRLFRRLSVFAGGWRLEAAETVCDADLDTLESLVEHSLVRRDGERFSMLETIRESALEQLEAHGELESANERLYAWALDLAKEASVGLESPAQAEWLERLHEEHDNLRAVLGLALEEGDIEVALRISAALSRYFWTRPGEAMTWLERGLSSREGVPQDVVADALRVAGETAWFLGDHAVALDRFHEGLVLFQKLGDEGGEAKMLTRSGPPLMSVGRLDEAEGLLERAEEIQARADNRYELALTRSLLAHAAAERGDWSKTGELLRSSLALARDLGDSLVIMNILTNLAETALMTDDPEQAVGLAVEALDLAWAVQDRITVLFCFATLAWASSKRGNLHRAAVLWGAAERLDEELGKTMWRTERATYEAGVGPQVLADEQAVSEGRALETQRAVEFALSID